MRLSDRFKKIGAVLTRWLSTLSKIPRSSCTVVKVVSIVALVCMAAPTHAIILFGSGDPETNTTAPGTALAVNGWNLQGYWGSFQGTPIGPHHFISATH